MTLIVDHSRRSSPALRFAQTVVSTVYESLTVVARFVAAEIDRRRTAQLLGYDDSLLRDIGLTRADVYSALMTPAGDKPSQELARQREERRFFERAQAREARAEGRHRG